MKKNLVLLTGIVLLITILAAGGCRNKSGRGGPVIALSDSTKVDIYLKDTLILGTMHLLMYDSKKPDSAVIDNHTVRVYGGYTVKWKNAKGSKIDEIKHIRTVGGDGTFFGAVPVVDTTRADNAVAFRTGIRKLIIPLNAPADTTVKYEIVFSIKNNGGSWSVDPYLDLP